MQYDRSECAQCLQNLLRELIDLVHNPHSTERDVCFTKEKYSTILKECTDCAHNNKLAIVDKNIFEREHSHDGDSHTILFYLINDVLQDWHSIAVAAQRSDLCRALKWRKSFNCMKELRYAVSNDDVDGFLYIMQLLGRSNNRCLDFVSLNKKLVENILKKRLRVCNTLLNTTSLVESFIKVCCVDHNFINILISCAPINKQRCIIDAMIYEPRSDNLHIIYQMYLNTLLVILHSSANTN